jgi:hypothetical protein
LTHEQRARRIAGRWARARGIRLTADQTADLAERIARDIATAVSRENEACARLVSQLLSTNTYPPNGLTGALRQRVPGAGTRSRRRPGWRRRARRRLPRR